MTPAGGAGHGGEVTYGSRVGQLAAAHPDAPAITFAPAGSAERVVTWRQLDERSTTAALALLQAAGADAASVVVVSLPTSPEHFVATLAGWKLGACVLPLSPAAPAAEVRAILAVVETWRPAVVIGDWPAAARGRPQVEPHELGAATAPTGTVLPDVRPEPGLLVASGGSTGTPKLVLNYDAQAEVPATGRLSGPPGQLGMAAGQVQLVATPLYHGAPVSWSHRGLFHDHHLVLMDRFDAARAVELIERHRVTWAFLVPTMMKRIAELPGIDGRDLASIEAVWHASAPCPEWVKRRWLDLLGPERVREAYGGSEANGATIVDGTEWMARPGTVGRPVAGWEVAVFGAAGEPLDAGVVGEIHMRALGLPPAFEYLGDTRPRRRLDGWTSLGDLGWLDADGFLYIADRRVDMIVTGGSNVYPAEVEGALSEHPAVADVVVVGVPDDDRGRRVHAVVVATDPARAPAADDLAAHCRTRLAPYKVPRSFTVAVALPRNEFGKIHRQAVADALAAGSGGQRPGQAALAP